jgi:DNA polymerase III delta prime subunit
MAYRLPSTDLLHEAQGRSPYDEQELKDIAVRIKSKFEEFNVLGSVVQINPGPVVTTFEFKPEAGIKYSRITTLTEDLCLGLQAESILIERIPGKPTVGIEVPNTKREVIALRQVLESDEFAQAQSRLTISMGKDINGRIKVASLESMPHLLIAGSTGSGKSVMINSMVMSILYKSTPDEVRMIMVDPKRVELGMYEGIPHLLTPVITDPKKATNALRNAVLEMDRRLRLLAEFGVRNIDQFNKKIRKKQEEPRNLFEEDEPTAEDLRPLPYILILIDELADLMMLEGRNVEESRDAPGADGARGGHAPGAGDAAAQRGRNHGADQGEFSIAHQFPRGYAGGLAHGAGRDGRRAPVGQGRYALFAAGFVAADPGARRVRDGDGDQPGGGFLERAGHAGIRSVVPGGAIGGRGTGGRRGRAGRTGPHVRRCGAHRAGDGQGIHIHLAAPAAVGLRPRGADPGYDAAGRDHRAAGWKQAAGSFEAAGLAAGGGGLGAVRVSDMPPGDASPAGCGASRPPEFRSGPR